MTAIMEFSLLPLDQEHHMSVFLERVTGIIRESGLPYFFGPASGSVEGEWDELMALATKCFSACAADSRHIAVHMRVLWRAGQSGRLANVLRTMEREPRQNEP